MIVGGKRYLLIGDVARELGVSVDTIRRWDRQGKFKPDTTEGGTRIYSPESIDLLLGKPQSKRIRKSQRRAKQILRLNGEGVKIVISIEKL